jgi:C_GCAxxG_C_C family probable redox protein
MNTKRDAAVAKFIEGYNCAQSVLWAQCVDAQIDGDVALRLACGFGAGMARKQEVCGAVTGGILALGLLHGRGGNDDASATERCYAKTRELMERFRERHGTILCRELLHGCELATPEGRAAFTENDLKTCVCIPCVETVMTILDDLQ